MSRSLKWVLTLLSAAIAFGACLWLGIKIASLIVPNMADADQWVAAAAFATVMATSASSCVAWWAGREKVPKFFRPGTIVQTITASAAHAVAQGAVDGDVINNGQRHSDQNSEHATELEGDES
jgi:hypothetical protein